MRHDLRERFAGIDRLYGRGAVERLDGRRVAVVGLGGVGAWAAEALARTGVGHLTLIDADDLCVSNTNRQLPAIAGQYGRNKAEAMAERVRAIHPQIDVDPVAHFLTASNLDAMLDRNFDLVLDACDSFRTKVVSIRVRWPTPVRASASAAQAPTPPRPTTATRRPSRRSTAPRP